ncbi:hypothetical protein C8R45DRAFT_538493 [Mycena sanguinolenta]|nr:hypothetical protein C8R45DRAFT_538493 [Mycena sanguinolenta]
MSQDSAAALSLLSLSMAASTVPPIPLDPASSNGNASAKHPAPAHHRRLSSTGRRRRLSDARDAASRPLSVGSPGLSMAALSLGPSTTSASASPTSAAPYTHAQMAGVPASAPAKSGSTPMPIPAPANGAGASASAANGGRKKRGVDHKCEACSKIYRHPSCLIKHRWEHTPHWRTLSALPHPGPGGSAAGVLSKHAQVQLLEAAAILSHLSPNSETGTSLPEDRGMWPRWVSGGSLEGEEPASFGSVGGASEFGPSSVGGDYPPSSVGGDYPPSSVSVGGSECRSGGPRLHDYEVPRGAEVRAGVVEVPHSRSYSHRDAHGHAHSYHHSTRHRHNGSGGWSVPRSVSVSASLSSSRSTPSDDEEAEEDEGDGDAEAGDDMGRGRRMWTREEEFGFEVDLGGVREEDGEDEYEEKEKERKGRYGKSESLRWGGMEEMDDIDMDMD